MDSYWGHVANGQCAWWKENEVWHQTQVPTLALHWVKLLNLSEMHFTPLRQCLSCVSELAGVKGLVFFSHWDPLNSPGRQVIPFTFIRNKIQSWRDLPLKIELVLIWSNSFNLKAYHLCLLSCDKHFLESAVCQELCGVFPRFLIDF